MTNDNIEKLLERCTNRIFKESFLDNFSKERQERKFLLKKQYNLFFKRVLAAMSIHIDEKSKSIDKSVMDLIMLRSIGLLSTAYLKRNKHDDKSRIVIQLEIDESHLETSEKDYERELNELFLEWAPLYSDYEEKPYDRELLALPSDMPYSEMYEFMERRFGYAFIGMKRLMILTEGKTEMLKRLIAIQSSDPALMWTIMANLAIKSINEIIGLKNQDGLKN